MKYLRLKEDDFLKLFNIQKKEFPIQCRDIIRVRDFRYRKMDLARRDKIITGILKKIDSNTLSVAGRWRQSQWECGWSENLKEYTRTHDAYSLTPKFIRPGQPLRLNRDFIMPRSNRFEFDFVDVLRRWLFSKYFRDKDVIYEFGCGSCQHLVVLSELFPEKQIIGLDWTFAAIKIIKKLTQLNKINLRGKHFNLFKPDFSYKLSPNCAVFTVGTLEQLGRNFEPFLKYLRTNKVSVCLHLETIKELYDNGCLLDYLALKFDNKRGYLDGFLERLRELEKNKKIQILKVQRINFGSLYHDGYSLILWRPKK
ncbi:MAG: class I SAM-dependent methyltransferase [Candidatus Omnitrophota bacterium]